MNCAMLLFWGWEMSILSPHTLVKGEREDQAAVEVREA